MNIHAFFARYADEPEDISGESYQTYVSLHNKMLQAVSFSFPVTSYTIGNRSYEEVKAGHELDPCRL